MVAQPMRRATQAESGEEEGGQPLDEVECGEKDVERRAQEVPAQRGAVQAERAAQAERLAREGVGLRAAGGGPAVEGVIGHGAEVGARQAGCKGQRRWSSAIPAMMSATPPVRSQGSPGAPRQRSSATPDTIWPPMTRSAVLTAPMRAMSQLPMATKTTPTGPPIQAYQGAVAAPSARGRRR